MRTRMIAAGALVVLATAVGLAATGHLPLMVKPAPKAADAASPGVAAIAVTAARALPADFIETVLVTGSLVPREEILVGPEVEGLRIVAVLADEGDRVTKGQVLARLVADTLEAQLGQNTAALARATAAMAQAKSNIVSAEARLTEAMNAMNRGKPLAKSGYLSESGMDQRESAAKTAEAALASARDGLKLAEADKAQVEAQRREITWKRGRAEIAAPADGIVSRRVARIGGFAAGAAEPMFRIIAKGEIELDAEVGETRLAKLKEGQPVEVAASGAPAVTGRIRLVSPEIDKATRLGRIRVFLGDRPELRIGAFARGTIETARSRGLAVPASAVLHGPDGARVQIIRDGVVATRPVKLGLEQGAIVEVREGLAEGDVVVAKAGTFLRDGDAVRAIISDVRRTSAAG